jgi:DNA-binding transcriptional regulator YdaS (Cro superfamily)
MDKINKFIAEYGVSDCQAAKLLGVSPGNLCSWKSGTRKLPLYIERCIDLHLDISKAHQKRIKELFL